MNAALDLRLAKLVAEAKSQTARLDADIAGAMAKLAKLSADLDLIKSNQPLPPHPMREAFR